MIQNTHLIVTPERFYIDRHGHPNAYLNATPAFNIVNDQIICLIRQTNTQIYANRQFHIGHQKSISKTMAMMGPDFHSLTTYAVEYDFGEFKKFDTYWEGMEDIQFVSDDKLLVVVPERNEGGMPCQFLAQLINHQYYLTIRLIEKLSPHLCEKNWMSFGDRVIYSVFPLVIKDLIKDDRVTVGEFKELEGYEGGTNGVLYNNWWWFLIHNHHSKTQHRWLTLNAENLDIKFSDPFYFYNHSFLEKAGSLVQVDDRWCISLSVDYRHAVIIEVDIVDF